MKQYPMPKEFDGGKFASRYGLSTLRGDFWSDGIWLYVPDNLPDDPPIFEPPDPLGPGLKDKLDAVKTLPELIKVLKEELP